MRTINLVCPIDKASLKKIGQSYICSTCKRTYPLENGVVRMLDQADTFYEGAYENQVGFLPRSERIWHTWPLWLITNGYPWNVRKFVPEDSVVVELGCAGGVRYFGNRYRMIGCDLSFSSLKKLDTIYGLSLQTNAAECIPLPDCSVDAVVSSYFWEHIPPSVKPSILAEIKRILRPGGKLIFLYDVETENPLISKYKKTDRLLYNRLFIDGDGHLGYQTSDENIALFAAAGFRLLEHQGMEKTWLQSVSAYTKLAHFNNSKSLLALASRLGRPPLFYIYTALLRIIDSLVCKLFPERWARIDLIVCEKKL